MENFCTNSLLTFLQFVLFRKEDIKKQLELFFREQWLEIEKDNKKAENEIIDSIIELFKLEYRQFLHVFHLERDPSLTDIIFKAVDAGKFSCIISTHSLSKDNLFC